MFRNFIPSEPKRKRPEMEEKSQDSLPPSRSSSQSGGDDEKTHHDSPKFKKGDVVEYNDGSSVSTVIILGEPTWKEYPGLAPAWYYHVRGKYNGTRDFASEEYMWQLLTIVKETPEKTISDRLKSLKKTRKKEHKILSGLFGEMNAVYTDLSMQLKLLLDGFDSKSDELGSREKAREWMQKKAAKRAEKGKPSGFDQGFLGLYEKLDQLVGPDGITYREAYRGPVKRSWHVDGLQLSSVDDLKHWNNHPIYIMWERRAPRQTSETAGGAKKKSNYNDYDEEGMPHLTWELPTAARDIMSTRTGRKALFPQGRLVIVIEKFKSENPANRREMITQHRVKGIYIVIRTPKRDDVKLCLVESRHFIEKFCAGERVSNVWFFDQQVDSDE